MKRLGWPMAVPFRQYLTVFAFLAAAMLTGCQGKTMLPQGGGSGTGTDLGFDNGGDGLDSDVSGIVQGAFDDSQDDLSQTQAPPSVGPLSQQQQFCSSATQAQGMDFFSQLTQPNLAGSTNACFAGQINPTQLLAQNYTQISVLAYCQQIALAQLDQTPQTPENIQALFFWATGFILRCANNSVAMEGAYAGALGQGIGIRRAALRSAHGVLGTQIRDMRP